VRDAMEEPGFELLHGILLITSHGPAPRGGA
jgi:hypothetical protein